MRPSRAEHVRIDEREGVALALAHAPQVILMDNRMPELTGREALLHLAGDPRTAIDDAILRGKG